MIGGEEGRFARRMMLILAVSEDTIKSARSFAEIRGASRTRRGLCAMDDILAAARLTNNRSVYVGTLARETVIESGAEHMGFNGYFLFETSDGPGQGGITILGKSPSLEAALELVELLESWHSLSPATFSDASAA